MWTRVVLEFARVVVATNNLKTCTSASLEVCANAAASTKAILGMEDGGTEVSEPELPTQVVPRIRSLSRAGM